MILRSCVLKISCSKYTLPTENTLGLCHSQKKFEVCNVLKTAIHYPFIEMLLVKKKPKISNQKLNIETGRNFVKISRCNTICPVCYLIIVSMRFNFCLTVQNIHQLETTLF